MTRVLVVVAHPDDEVIFFGGTIARHREAGASVDVACATSEFAPATLGAARRGELRHACRLLGARAILLPLADAPGGLDRSALAASLRDLVADEPDVVYTHGPWGEYGHRHHTDACWATHLIFDGRVRSLAGPCPADRIHRLDESELARKRGIAERAHRSQPFASDWCTREECFVDLSFDEADLLATIALLPGEDAGALACVARRLAACGERGRRLVAAALAGLAAEEPPPAEVRQVPSHLWAEVSAGRHAVLARLLRQCALSV